MAISRNMFVISSWTESNEKVFFFFQLSAYIWYTWNPGSLANDARKSCIEELTCFNVTSENANPSIDRYADNIRLDITEAKLYFMVEFGLQWSNTVGVNVKCTLLLVVKLVQLKGWLKYISIYLNKFIVWKSEITLGWCSI